MRKWRCNVCLGLPCTIEISVNNDHPACGCVGSHQKIAKWEPISKVPLVNIGNIRESHKDYDHRGYVPKNRFERDILGKYGLYVYPQD